MDLKGVSSWYLCEFKCLSYFGRKSELFKSWKMIFGNFYMFYPFPVFFEVLSILTAVVGSTWLIKLRMAARTWQSARMICCSNLRAADLTLAWKGKENIQKLQNWQNLTQILFIWAYSFSLNNNVHNETELFIKYYFLFWYCSWLFSTNSLPYFDLNCSLSQKNA